MDDRPMEAKDCWWRGDILPSIPGHHKFMTIGGTTFIRRDVVEEMVAEGIYQERVRSVMERQMAKTRLIQQQARRTARIVEACMMLSLWSVAAWLAWRALACWF